MHSKSIWRALLLTALAALVAGVGTARAQGEPQVYAEDYAPADPVWPFPIGSTHPENGGLFVSASFVSYRQTNPLHSQVVAVRGFQTSQTTIIADDPVVGERIGGVVVDDVNDNITTLGPAGTLLGSGTPALDTKQVGSQNTFQPGTKIELGWKFGDGSAFSVSWLFITEVNIGASATFAAPGNRVGPDSADSFLFSPVFNFPNEFSGPLNKITVHNPEFDQPGSGDNPLVVSAPGAVNGIWNGASIETEQFLQRTQQYEATYRVPMYETECYRISGLVGPRFTWIWERYKWVAQSLDENGIGEPDWTAQYTNVTSNRLYGAHFGLDQECYIGHGFAWDLTVQCSVYEDSTKEQAKYQLARGAFGQANPGPIGKKSRHVWTFVPAPEAALHLSWFPIEAVEIRAGYDVQAFFNTVSMHQPVGFNFGAPDPRYETNTVRLLDGLDFGIGINF